MKIGFFDSGLGGLTILKAVVKELPQYDYVYYGDTLHLPYGDKTEEEIFTLTKTGIEYLFEKGCVLVIVACNTASAETLRKLQDSWLLETYPDRKVLGVIVPTLERVLEVIFQTLHCWPLKERLSQISIMSNYKIEASNQSH
jgi:glutamate racemase